MAQDIGTERTPTVFGAEENFATDFIVHVRGYGHKHIVASEMLARIQREMQLLFSDNVEVEQLGKARNIQLQQHEVESEEVPQVDPETIMSGLPLTPFAAG